jgi:hypothetical protein
MILSGMVASGRKKNIKHSVLSGQHRNDVNLLQTSRFRSAPQHFWSLALLYSGKKRAP